MSHFSGNATSQALECNPATASPLIQISDIR